MRPDRAGWDVVVIGVVGATGFIGQWCARAAADQGHRVVSVRAPRLSADPRAPLAARLSEADSQDEVARLEHALASVDVVINAAGMATATRMRGVDELYGANALTPLVGAVAAQRAGCSRLVHVSSAAVQGAGTLDESEDLEPFSPYSHSKAMGEIALREWGGTMPITRFRPTSVHGAGRSVTHTLARFSRSGFSSVAGDGRGPTPQVLAQNVGAAIAYCAGKEEVPPVVLQPSEGLTCGGVLEALSLGRQPRHVPRRLASGVVGAAKLQPWLRGQSRRLEMLWFGQAQRPGWLDRQGWEPPATVDAWRRLGAELHFTNDQAA